MRPTPCGARKRDGTLCAQPALTGMARCHYHGGKSPNAIAARDRHQQNLAAQKRATAMVTAIEGHVVTDPLMVLVQMVQSAATAAEAYRRLVAEDADVVEEVSYGVQGKRLEPSARVKMWNEERDRLVKYTSAALSAGVQQRQLKMAEDQANAVVDAIYAVFDDLGLQGAERERARTVAATRLRVISPPDGT